MAQEQTFQVGIKALVRSIDGDILLIKEMGQDRPRYDLPGGRMQPGETFAQTLARELSEELGCTEQFEQHLFATSLSSAASIDENGRRFGLILVIFEVVLSDYRSLRALEEATSLEWHAPPNAATLLVDKYSDDFCKQIKELT